MNMFAKILFSAVAVVGLTSFVDAQSPTPTATTIVSVPEMHCPSCAKKMTAEILKVQGVGQVAANIEGKTMVITARVGATPSPRQIWEAVERSGYQPARLTGPSGDFKAKPQS